MVTKFRQFFYEEVILEKKNPEAKEQGHLAAFKKEIERVKKETGKDHVVVHHNGEEYHITGAEKTEGNPKSDFTLVGKDGRHIYLSHKDYKGSGDLAKSYQQLGGVSKFKDHPSVQKFADAVNKEHGGTAVDKGTIARKLNMKTKQDRTLVNKAIFGREHEEGGERGPNAVHSIVHGTMRLVPSPRRRGVFHIHAEHIMHHTDEPEGDYMIYGRTAQSGSSKRNDLGLKHTRVLISSQQSRTVSHWVK
jgi:hypothetical protein